MKYGNKPYVIYLNSLSEVKEHRLVLKDIYDEFGVIIFPKLLTENSLFQAYTEDLRGLFARELGPRDSDSLGPDLGDLLTALANRSPMRARWIADLGTQNNKLWSFNVLKYSELISDLIHICFGGLSVVATPQAGDTLHFFPPGESFHRYNLPIHQDYPYLMQSPRQITFYLGLSDYHQGVGGLRIWEASHRLGILRTSKSREGAFEINYQSSGLKTLSAFDYHWSSGDFGVFDSLLCHASIPNESQSHSRVVQIFRFSDLKDPISTKYDSYSAVYQRRGVTFEDIHPELVE